MTISDIKRYWNSRPCNARHSDIDIATHPLSYSREVTERKLFVEPHIVHFMDAKRWRDKYVLDLGCGIGTQAILFARAGALVHGIDISEKSISIAEERRGAEGLENLFFTQGNIEYLGDWEKFFDLVFSFGVIHHTPNPRRALEEAYRVLKPLGELRLMVYNRFSWKVLWIVLKYGKGRFWEWKKLIPQHSEAQTGCPVTWTYTKSDITQLLSDVGFTVESVWIDHIFPYRIKDYKNEKRYVKEWYWRLCPQRLFKWLERRFGWHMMVVAKK